MRLGKMHGAEIFLAGTHRGYPYTVADLDDVVRNFRLARAVVQPPLALGHENYQTLLTALADDPDWTARFQERTFADNSGSPAIGWVRDVWREGTRLKANIEDIPGKIADLMDARMLHRFSAELYPAPPADAPAGCKGMMLKRVSVMGTRPPELKTLADWHALLFGEGEVEVRPWVIHQVVEAAKQPAGTWEVFMESSSKGVDTVDRKALEKQLLDAGYSETTVRSLAVVPDTDFPALVADAVKKPAPPPVVPPPVVPIAEPIAPALAAQFAEMQATAASLRTELASLKARQQAEEAESRRRQQAERSRTVEAFCERWSREAFVLPREVDKTSKTPNLFHRLMAADGSQVRKFGETEATDFDALVSEIEGRGPGFARRHFSEQIEQPDGGKDSVVKEAQEYAKKRNEAGKKKAG